MRSALSEKWAPPEEQPCRWLLGQALPFLQQIEPCCGASSRKALCVQCRAGSLPVPLACARAPATDRGLSPLKWSAFRRRFAFDPVTKEAYRENSAQNSDIRAAPLKGAWYYYAMAGAALVHLEARCHPPQACKVLYAHDTCKGAGRSPIITDSASSPAKYASDPATARAYESLPVSRMQGDLARIRCGDRLELPAKRSA